MAKIRDIEITAVDEVPVADSIVENYEADVPEEVVQSVAEAIVLEAEEQDKTVEEVVSEIVEESIEKTVEEIVKNKKLDYASRGFKSLDAAYDFVNTERFANLGDADKIEFINWLKK